MKVLLLTDSFGGGGAERVASLLINGLSELDYVETHVCVFLDVPNYKIDKSKIHFHLLSPKQYPYAINVLNRMRNLVKVLKDVKPNTIFSFGPIMASYVVPAVKMSGLWGKIKIVSSERNDPRKEPVSYIKRLIRDYCYNQSDIIVCQTPMAVKLLKERGINTQYTIIPNPMSPNLPQWKGIDSKNIITACRLTEQKNLPLLIDAFARLHEEYPSYRLTIYGEGELRIQMQTYIEKKNLGEVIKMPGFAKNIHQIMAQSYMYVSSSDYEGISNSMLESLGIGLPCVCTDCPVGGSAMYIKDGVSGFLTKVGDGEALYQVMKRLLCDRELAENVSENSRQITRQLTLSSITQQWINLVE